MTYTTQTTIAGPSRGTPETALALIEPHDPHRLEEVRAYVAELYRLAPVAGIRAEVALIQAIHETGWFTSSWWRTHLNPAGIGITGDPAQNERSRVFPSGTIAARAQLVHLAAYALGPELPEALAPYQAEDPRWQAVLAAGYAGLAPRIGDLAGTWAADPDYDAKLVRHLNELAPKLGEPLEPETVPESPAVIAYTPRIVDSWLTEPYQGRPGAVRYHSRGGMLPRAIVIHVQEGSNNGTKQHFRVVKASSTVLIAKDGLIERLVPEQYAPWTNGDVRSPDALMRSLMNRYGWDPNTWTLTIENEGYSGGLPYTEAQFLSNVWQVRDWMSRYPIEAIAVVGHFQINSETRSACPDPGPHAFLRAIQGAIGEVPVIPIEDGPHRVVVDPWPVKDAAGKAWDGRADLVLPGADGKAIRFEGERRTVTVAVDVLNARQWASTASNLTAHGKVRGERIAVLGWVLGEDVSGEARWWVDALGNRYWAGGTSEKPTADPPVIETPDDPADQPDQGNWREFRPVLSGGTIYYPFERKGEARYREMRVVSGPANLRQWAGTGHTIVGSVAEGQTVRVSHWCRGEAVRRADGAMEDLWAVIDDGSAQPVYSAPRIWMGLLDERPD